MNEEEIYVITYFDKKTLKYKGTINAAFQNKELAKEYAAECDNRQYKFNIVAIPFFK